MGRVAMDVDPRVRSPRGSHADARLLRGAVQVIRVQTSNRRAGDTATGRASNLSQTRPGPRFVIINSIEAGRLSLAVMPKTTRYKHKEGRHLCTRIPRLGSTRLGRWICSI